MNGTPDVDDPRLGQPHRRLLARALATEVEGEALGVGIHVMHGLIVVDERDHVPRLHGERRGGEPLVFLADAPLLGHRGVRGQGQHADDDDRSRDFHSPISFYAYCRGRAGTAGAGSPLVSVFKNVTRSPFASVVRFSAFMSFDLLARLTPPSW